MKHIIEHFGRTNQINKAKEELAELIVALSKDNKENVLEEMVDVIIMLRQLHIIYEFSEMQVIMKMKEKYRRVSERIKREKENGKK